MTAAAAVLLLVSLPAEAQWKWKDKGGRIQYSDLPPPAGTPDQDILSRPNASRRAVATPTTPASAASGPFQQSAASAPLRPRVVEPELEAKLKKAEADQAAKVKALQEQIAAAKADNCTRAQAQLRTLDSGIRIAQTNVKGEREIMDDQKRAEETKRTKDMIAADCAR